MSSEEIGDGRESEKSILREMDDFQFEEAKIDNILRGRRVSKNCKTCWGQGVVRIMTPRERSFQYKACGCVRAE